MKTPELKPCPFCGGEASIVLDDQTGGWYVCCQECYSQTDTKMPSRSVSKWLSLAATERAIETAVSIWNRRANDDA